jgi:drug/metabolite transporter (DMT)-like permease
MNVWKELSLKEKIVVAAVILLLGIFVAFKAYAEDRWIHQSLQSPAIYAWKFLEGCGLGLVIFMLQFALASMKIKKRK